MNALISLGAVGAGLYLLTRAKRSSAATPGEAGAAAGQAAYDASKEAGPPGDDGEVPLDYDPGLGEPPPGGWDARTPGVIDPNTGPFHPVPTDEPPAATQPKGLPLSIAERMAIATASGDPAVLRAEAANLLREGYEFEAAQLEGFANAIDAYRGTQPPPEPLPIPKPGPEPQTPGVPPADVSPRKVLAMATAAMLQNIHDRGRVSTDARAPATLEAVKKYQNQEQPQAGAVDGLYGPKTAATFINYGLVPPHPFLWPKANTQAAKNDYEQLLREQAELDPSRAAEWLSAADRVKRS